MTSQSKIPTTSLVITPHDKEDKTKDKKKKELKTKNNEAMKQLPAESHYNLKTKQKNGIEIKTRNFDRKPLKATNFESNKQRDS